MTDTAEKPVIVTGGASGIGLAIVRRLIAEGYPVGVFDLNEGALQELVAAYGSTVHTFALDIVNHDAVVAAVAEFEQRVLPVYGLVNNAGWDEAHAFVKTNPDFWRKVLDINLVGPLNVTHAVLSGMASRKSGRVISIASDAGRVGSSGEAVYSAAKGGVIALMKTLAREHARHGITFNSVCPGPTDTPLLADFDPTGRLAQSLGKAVPMQRIGQPEDFPGLVAFFLSDEASYITGQTISVSGGLSMNG